tara:strand:- start:1333 stop:1995 length:663 start_codon:yes stop_codon:yes gene_type:complete
MTVNIPTSLEDISLDNWIKFDAINKEGSDEDFLIDKMIEIFCELPLKEVAKIPFNDAQDIYKDLVAVLNEESKFEPIINVDGTDFGFIPNLNEITLGEFVDLDNYLLSTKDLNKAMAVLYRPITYRNKDLYRIEEYDNPDKYKDVLGKQSVSFATGAVVFFYSLSKELTKHSLFSSLKEVKEETNKTIQQKDNSLLNTAGYNLSTPYVKETLQSLIKSLN